MGRYGIHNHAVLRAVHAKGLFAKQVLSRRQNGWIYFRVQHMGYGAIDGVNLG